MHSDAGSMAFRANSNFNNRLMKKVEHMSKHIDELRTVVNSRSNALRDLIDLNYYLKHQLETLLGPQSIDLSQLNGGNSRDGGTDSAWVPSEV